MHRPEPMPAGRYHRGRPRATVIGFTTDIDGAAWAVRERRPTRHGFDVELGWPADRVPGPGNKGVGSPRVILTDALARYLRGTPRNHDIDLPIGHGIVARFRKAVRMDYRTQRARWWDAHLEELKALDAATFAARHGLKPDAVTLKRRQLLGTSWIQRPARWWRRPENVRILQTLPTREAAERFGVSDSAVNYWKRKLGIAPKRA